MVVCTLVSRLAQFIMVMLKTNNWSYILSAVDYNVTEDYYITAHSLKFWGGKNISEFCEDLIHK